MRLLRSLIALPVHWVHALKAEVKLALVLLRFPSLRVQRPSVWQYDTPRAFAIGDGVWVGPFTEVVAYERHRHSRVSGKLILGDGAILAAGCNVRAAGGVIAVGAQSGIGQNCVLVAANHTVRAGETYTRGAWDEEKTGITIGKNVWVAANCVILPGVVIGDNAVIAAGSVVTKSVPANEIWAGIPAKFLKRIDGAAEPPAERPPTGDAGGGG